MLLSKWSVMCSDSAREMEGSDMWVEDNEPDDRSVAAYQENQWPRWRRNVGSPR